MNNFYYVLKSNKFFVFCRKNSSADSRSKNKSFNINDKPIDSYESDFSNHHQYTSYSKKMGHKFVI